ncbi:NUDIX domain-containing protein [Kitasatospora arboriphila]
MGEAGSRPGSLPASAAGADDLLRAVRRIGGALHTFGAAFEPGWTGELRTELAWLLDLLGREPGYRRRSSRLLAALDSLSDTGSESPGMLAGHAGAPKARALLERQLTLARTRTHTALLQELRTARLHALADRMTLLSGEVPLLDEVAGRGGGALVQHAAGALGALAAAAERLPLARAAEPYGGDGLHRLAVLPAARSASPPTPTRCWRRTTSPGTASGCWRSGPATRWRCAGCRPPSWTGWTRCSTATGTPRTPPPPPPPRPARRGSRRRPRTCSVWCMLISDWRWRRPGTPSATSGRSSRTTDGTNGRPSDRSAAPRCQSLPRPAHRAVPARRRARHAGRRARLRADRAGRRGVLWVPGGPKKDGRGLKKPRIAVIHRPKYDDWSLPKGKLEPGEGWQAAALRELREETGMHCVLGQELPAQHYLVDG